MEGISENTYMSENNVNKILEVLSSQDISRAALKQDVLEISDALKLFQKQYDHDMRGEPRVNGYKGLIGEVQELKDAVCKYPSFLYVLAKNPLKTLLSLVSGAIVFVTFWFALHALTLIPAVEVWFRELLKLPPLP
jgi:hypothetical protein